MRRRLLWKLFSINLPVIGVVILVIWLAIDYLAADYFTVLMQDYQIAPTTTHQMFLEAVHRYLIWASLLALACANALQLLPHPQSAPPTVGDDSHHESASG